VVRPSRVFGGGVTWSAPAWSPWELRGRCTWRETPARRGVRLGRPEVFSVGPFRSGRGRCRGRSGRCGSWRGTGPGGLGRRGEGGVGRRGWRRSGACGLPGGARRRGRRRRWRR